MEEKKIVSKEVRMQPGSPKDGQPQKLSYEELNQACGEMSQQLQGQNKYIQQLHKQMQEMRFALQARRMDYLLKVVELSMGADKVYGFNSDFVNSCIAEIQETLAIPQEEGKEEPKED